MRVSDHPEYSVWQGMKRRCDNPNFKQFHQYGGRGIKVCDRWKHDFAAFLHDMGDRPSDLHTLDRIDPDGNYTPENCRWATRKEQARNIRKNRYIEHNGKRILAIEVAEQTGLKADTIVNRFLAGHDIFAKERIVFKPGLALGGLANGARQRARTHCKWGHAFDEQNTSWTPQGTRRCKMCHKFKMRRLKAAKRAREAGEPHVQD